MDNCIHPSQLLHVSSDDIPRDNTSNQLDHTVRNTGNDVDREKTVRVPGSVVGLVICGKESDLASSSRITDHQDGRDQTEGEDGAGEDGTRGELFDEGRDEDGADTLHGAGNRVSYEPFRSSSGKRCYDIPVQTGKNTNLLISLVSETLVSEAKKWTRIISLRDPRQLGGLLTVLT